MPYPVEPRSPLLRVFLALLALLALATPVAVLAEEVVTHIHSDAFGNPMLATDAQGNVVWRESYRPFGARLDNTDNRNRLWFHGKEVDAESGLVYFGARYYDPVVGRFMGVDSIGFNEGNPHSFNRYAYANNNPYKFADRDGRAPTPLDVFLLSYDVGSLIYQTSTGGDVKGAMADVGISSAALMVPIPGAALGMKMVRGAEAVRAAEHALAPEGVTLTSRAARREAMREAGIPTSQQPASQIRTEAGRQLTYEVPSPGGGSRSMVVTDQTTDRVIGHGPHWEAGAAKVPERTDALGRLRVVNEKARVDYVK